MSTVTRAQLDAALRKATAVWVRPAGHPARLVWAVWSTRGAMAGSLLIACGGTEQHVPGLADGGPVEVVVARPGTRSALATIATTALRLEPDAATTATLAAARRNATPGWTQVYRLALG